MSPHLSVRPHIHAFPVQQLYEKAKQYQQIVQYYMEKNSYADVIESCKKYALRFA